MAQRLVTTLVDDLDGTELPRGNGVTVRFGLDGHSYEIDLTEANAAALREAVEPFVAAGRRVIPRKTHRRRSRSS